MIPVIIPAYEPDERLIELLKDIIEETESPIVIVNDGSHKEYDDIFNRAKEYVEPTGGFIISHDINRGKGRALKSAFKAVIESFPSAIGVVTADSDGQHTAKCIKKVSEVLEENPNNLIFGVRNFESDNVPSKSKWGNNFTIKAMKYLGGVSVSDTQTGLRGIPIEFAKELLNVRGERFEFETRMLIASASSYDIIECPIETVYDSKENHQTHYRPVRDSIRIFSILIERFIGYMFSSLSASVIDIAVFTLVCNYAKGISLPAYIFVATCVARIISATYNYMINYKLVFKSKSGRAESALKYAALVVVQGLLSASLVTLFSVIFKGVFETIIKLVVDVMLFFASYYIQQSFVFKNKTKK